MSLIPKKTYTGFPLTVTIPQGDYKAANGYTLKVILRGPQNSELTAAASDDNYTVELTAAASGTYLYTVVAESTTARHLIETGQIEFLPDPTSADASDLRTHAQKVLEAIEAVLEKRATKAEQSYSIAGRSITKIPLAELYELRNKYKAEVQTQRGRAPKRFVARFA